MKNYLTIFQLEGYDISRFIQWLKKSKLNSSISEKKKLIYTPKAKLLLLSSYLINVLVLFIFDNVLIGFAIALILFTQPFILLILSQLLMMPLEHLAIKAIIFKTSTKIKSLNNLIIIGITGSYGKTSVKELLFQLIKDKYRTIRTPESYNTPLGIAKVVDYELDQTYQIFICEMAAYGQGDIKKLCQLFPPKYGVLTGITSQHLERFGTLKNITSTKFELYDSVADKSNVLFNIHDKNVLDEIKQRKINNCKFYLNFSNVIFDKNGAHFDLFIENKVFEVQTNLFGYSNIENLVGAISMALILDVNIEDILIKTKNLTPIQSRMILKNIEGSTIVDNTFSSNEKSFEETIRTAKDLTGRKLLITPGLVELGQEEENVNSRIGNLASGIFDKIILVGSNSRTKSFSKEFDSNFEFIEDNRKDYFETIEKYKKEFEWIFLENDLTQNY